MIKAILYISGEEISGFDVSGHAEYAPYGEDIVCAAVSILTIATVNSLEAQLGEVQAQVAEEGRVTCFLPEKLDARRLLIAQSILKTLEMGLANVAQAYPDYIRLTRTKIDVQRRCTGCLN